MLPVVFAINEGYLNPLRVALLSLFRCAKQESVYDVYILEYDLQDRSKALLLEDKDRWHLRGKVTFLKITAEEWGNLQLDNRWGVESRFRYYIPQKLPQYDQALYLDTDVLVQDDLSDLYNISLDNMLFAGVMEERSSYRNYIVAHYCAKIEERELVFTPHTTLYPNSGVLMMNLALMREINFTQRAIHLSRSLPSHWLLTSRHDFFVMPDQDVLYYLAFEHSSGICWLPDRYNHIVGYYYYKDLPQFVPAEQYDQHTDYINAISGLTASDADRKPAIIHYADTAPWNKKRGLVPYEKLYRSYAKEIGWKLPNKWLINTMTWFKRRYFYSKTTRDAWGRKGMVLLVLNLFILLNIMLYIIFNNIIRSIK